MPVLAADVELDVSAFCAARGCTGEQRRNKYRARSRALDSSVRRTARGSNNVMPSASSRPLRRGHTSRRCTARRHKIYQISRASNRRHLHEVRPSRPLGTSHLGVGTSVAGPVSGELEACTDRRSRDAHDPHARLGHLRSSSVSRSRSANGRCHHSSLMTMAKASHTGSSWRRPAGLTDRRRSNRRAARRSDRRRHGAPWPSGRPAGPSTSASDGRASRSRGIPAMSGISSHGRSSGSHGEGPPRMAPADPEASVVRTRGGGASR